MENDFENGFAKSINNQKSLSLTRDNHGRRSASPIMARQNPGRKVTAKFAAQNSESSGGPSSPDFGVTLDSIDEARSEVDARPEVEVKTVKKTIKLLTKKLS